MTETTRHLPECPSTSPDPLAADCCCARLHAVERRIANKIAALLVEGIDWKDGFAAGLAAAREAVAALPPTGIWATDVSHTKALAAIDALREKP